MGQIDWIMYLTATTFYALSSIVYIYSLVFKKEERIGFAAKVALAGLLFHSVSIALRWAEVGHGPYVGTFEISSGYAWASVAIFLITQQKFEKIRSAGFATIAFGSLLVAVGIATLYILKERFENNNKDSQDADSFYKRLPSLDIMDEMMYSFVAFGLIDLTIIIGTGAIWANQTWGRYWGWDPIETWSLISWFTYAICLHLRVNMGWNGKRIAWVIIFSIFVLAFSLYGVGYVYGGLHADYLTT